MLIHFTRGFVRASVPTSTRSDGAGWRAAARARLASFGVALSWMLLLIGPSARAHTPVGDGFRDFSYGSAVTPAVTGEKAESKLWWIDGFWWGSLFNPSVNRYRIYRFDPATQSWTDTGTS